METDLFDKIEADQGKTFEKYLDENPEVWELFLRYARQLRRSGRQRGSADAILHRIRWDSNIQSSAEKFKVNNNYRKQLAEKLVYIDPTFAEFFEFREKGGEIGTDDITP